MRTLHVNLGENSYDIVIDKGILSHVGEEVGKVVGIKKAFVVTDTNVQKYYLDRVISSLQQAGFETGSAVLPAGEQTKDLSTLPILYNHFLDAGLTRSDVVLALGGGVVGDIVGFAAATYLRGIAYIQVPTSLLAQVDSSVGGKTAADLPRGKNLVGAFNQPKRVIIDPDVLDTLEDRYYRDGMGEVIKHGCIKDKDFFEQLESGLVDREEMLYANCRIKAAVVERDERDVGERMLLNFGHTLGHAVETYYHYEGFSHGEAVSIGMYNITKMAEAKGLTKSGTADRLQKVLQKYGLPHELPEMDEKAILEAVSHDKKNLHGSLNFILLKEIGEAYIYKADPLNWGGLRD